jgi:hypothetical protein
MEEEFGPEYSSWVERLGEQRRRAFQDAQIDCEKRRAILHEQANAAAFEVFRTELFEERPRPSHLERES